MAFKHRGRHVFPDGIQPGSGSATHKTLKAIRKGTVAVNPGNAVAGAQVTVDVAIPDFANGDEIIMSPPGTLEAGLVFKQAKFQSAGTVRITLFNPTAGAIDGASLAWDYTHFDLT